MSNYNSNYEIAQAISERIGAEPIPFDSVYSLCFQIYQELGGTKETFDDIYKILLDILPKNYRLRKFQIKREISMIKDEL